MRVAWVAVVALFLSGCSSSAPPAPDAGDALPDGGVPTLSAQPVPMRFASGDYESITPYEASFQPTDVCMPQCQGNAVQVIDITGNVPAEAPVELAISVQHDGSVRSTLVFEDTYPVRVTTEGNGGQGGGGGGGGNTQISALVSRASSGTVSLRLTHSFNAFPPSAEPVKATIEVRSVVRGDNLAGGMPAQAMLEPGAQVNFTNGDLERVAMFFPDGSVLYDVDAPFTLTVPNGTKGPTILMAIGGDTQAVGPNTTLLARRVEVVRGDPKDIANGAATNFDLTTAGPPLLVGVTITRKPTYEFVSAAPLLGPHTVTIITPNNVNVLDETPSCDLAFCEFNPFPFGGDGNLEYYTEYMGEYLVPGAYKIIVAAEQANNYQGTPYHLQFAAA